MRMRMPEPRVVGQATASVFLPCLLTQERLHDRELIALEEEVESVYDSDQDNDDEDENADL